MNNSKNKGSMRLSLRIAILVFLVESVLLGIFAVSIYYYCRTVFYHSLDLVLRANAESLATLVQPDDDSASLELNFADEIMKRFSRNKRPDLFAVFLGNGTLLDKSIYLKKIPSFVNKSIEPVLFRNFKNYKGHYRGVVLLLKSVDENHLEQGVPLRVFFASSTHSLEENLEEIRQQLIWYFAIGLFFSGILAGLVSWKGLVPLRNLAKSTGRIHEDSLSHRLSTNRLPRDLLPLANALNELLSRLEKAFAKERRFSSDAAHELRTPVAILKSGIQAALLVPQEAGEDRKVLSELLEDVERLELLCDSLLLIARTCGNSSDYMLSAEEWVDEILNTYESLKTTSEAQGLSVQINTPEKMPGKLLLKTDMLATRRISMNLINNAIVHCGEGTTLLIEIKLKKDVALLSIKDDGPGIKPEDALHLFERFYRVDKSRNRVTGGFGLGLAISQGLAGVGGGKITFEPVNPHGSCFTWYCSTHHED